MTIMVIMTIMMIILIMMVMIMIEGLSYDPEGGGEDEQQAEAKQDCNHEQVEEKELSR